jgi:L,D-transpeptidase ErfK/SrfK
MRITNLIFILLILSCSPVHASGAFLIDNPSDAIVGMAQTYIVAEDETLIELARIYDVGFNEMTAANPSVDPWIPEKGTEIVAPTSWIIPEILSEGVIINLPEMRLYLFLLIEEKQYVITYPIGIGQQGMHTPLGIFTITGKVTKPVWKVPESIRKEEPELPPFVRPGPDNPLGEYWLQISVKGYGIHGTNRPHGIGRRVSHGCIRLYPEDIDVLFKYLKPGAQVKIINEPIKVTLHNNKVYIEVHSSEMTRSELLRLAVKKLSRKNLLEYVESRVLLEAIQNSTGLPAMISR